MASISSTSSLGNTALRGYGGMATGIDRDAIIEQMTLGTTTKITKRENEVTEWEWKQEAYRSISDKILGLQDSYFSFAGTTSLKNGSLFSKSVITALGDSDSTKFVSASGSSDMLEYVSILGVKQLASSATQQSKAWVNGITTSVGSLDDTFDVSNLRGSQLRFGVWNEKDGAFDSLQTFELPSTYTDDNGKAQEINYTAKTPEEKKQLAAQLNEALKDSSIKFGDTKISDAIRFEYDEASDSMKVVDIDNKFSQSGYSISGNSTALRALGYKGDVSLADGGISLEEYNDNLGSFSDAFVDTVTVAEYMKDKTITINYNGTKKDVVLLEDGETDLNTWAKNLQSRLDTAFGNGAVTVSVKDGTLAFTASDTSTLTISSEDADLLKGLGLENGASSKVNLDASLDKANLGITNLDSYLREDGKGGKELALTINGVDIHGLTEKSSVQDILDAINSTEEAGVKATYVDTTGQFVLIAAETGKGRQIDLGVSGTLAKDLFGNVDSTGKENGFTEGKDAQITVSYGNSVEVTLERSSNTFDLEGMSVTVSGVFGYDASGSLDSSKAVSFSAKADVDAAVEAVKQFFEDYNALASEVNTQLTTRHDSDYGPLTDEQKDEMSEESIKNWEEKAKQGILNNDSILRDLNSALGGIFLQMLQSGVSSQDLEKIGISYSEDSAGGGTLVFDETAFRQAMENDPEKVSDIFTGGGGVSKGLAQIMEDTLTPYATRYASKNGGSYGRLIEQAGSEKVPLSTMDNYIYKQLQELQDQITELRAKLVTEQDRYISQFTAMETAISQMNTQAGWLSSLQG